MSSSQRASAGLPSFTRRDAGNAEASALQCKFCVMLAQCNVRAQKRNTVCSIITRCYSCLRERILRCRSSAPSGSQQRVLVPDSYSIRYSIRTCEHLTPCHALPSSRRVTICTLSLARTERYHGPLDRLTHLDKARQTRSRTSRERSAGFALATHVDQC